MTEVLLILLAVQNCTTYPVRGSVKSTDDVCVERTYDCLEKHRHNINFLDNEAYKKCIGNKEQP